jgi:hypothetical protein
MTEVSTYILRFMNLTLVQETVVYPALFAGSENVVCPVFPPPNREQQAAGESGVDELPTRKNHRIRILNTRSNSAPQGGLHRPMADSRDCRKTAFLTEQVAKPW